MKILAIDPGTTESGFYAGPGHHGTVSNEHMRLLLQRNDLKVDMVAIEMIASYGMPVGKEVFETCLWIGRFIEAWNGQFTLVYRKDVKLALCGTPRAKDSNVWQALVDIYGPPGTKKEPGGTYGVRSHARAAMAVWHVAKGIE